MAKPSARVCVLCGKAEGLGRAPMVPVTVFLRRPGYAHLACIRREQRRRAAERPADRPVRED